MAYHTNVGPLSGPLLSSAGYLAIRVLQARQAHTPIGVALVAGQDQNGWSLWRLTIDGIELPGLYVVINREFRPVEQRMLRSLRERPRPGWAWPGDRVRTSGGMG
jgi:hypothetical protein